jgi:hypothetical protein
MRCGIVIIIMPLFEVAIIRKPTKKEIDEGTGDEELILGPVAVVARNTNSAVIAAISKEGGGKTLDPNRCEVIVRSFT